MSLVENTLLTFDVKFSGPKIYWCTNNDNVDSVDNVFGTYMQYLCKVKYNICANLMRVLPPIPLPV